MTRLFALSALIPALMTSTALAADVLAEPVVVEEAPAFTLTGTAGVVGFWLPEYDPGLFDTFDDPLFGGMIGLSGSGTIGPYNDWDLIWGFNVFGAFAGGDSSSTQSFSGDGTLYISGLSTPGGDSEITLDTDTAGTASVTLSPPPAGPDSSVTATGGAISAATVVPGGTDGFMVGAATTDAAGETAFGAIAAPTGGIAVITGDLTGLEITTDVDRNIFYTGADLTLGLGSGAHGDVAFSVYTGPSYRGLFQNITTDVSIDLPEATGGAGVTLPGFTISSDENLNSHYFGGILGGTASFGVAEGVVFSVGVEGGVYGVHSNWNGTDTFSTSGGVFDDPNDVPDAGSIVQTPLTITGTESEIDDIDNDTIAFAARGNAAVTWAFSENQAISLGGSLEYLSQVATVTHDRVLEVPYDDNASWSAGDDPTGEPSFSWGSMVNFAITASLTGTF